MPLFANVFDKGWTTFKRLSPTDLAVTFIAKPMIKYPTTPQTLRYTTLWNISVIKQQQSETYTAINGTAQRSAAKWFGYGGSFNHYFITKVLLSVFWKNFLNLFIYLFLRSSTFGKVMGEKLIASSALCVGAMSSWKLKKSLKVWWAGIVVRVSSYD